MPAFRLFRMKDAPRQQFRQAPHTSGATLVKRKDYEEAGSVEAATVYAAWHALRSAGKPVDVGDVFELEDGELRICKYVGFEEARWLLPEAKSGVETLPTAVSSSERAL